MQVLTILQEAGILHIAVVIGIIGIISKARTQFLDEVLLKVQKKWLKWLIMSFICLALSTGLTSLNFIAKFSIQEYLKMSIMNWIFAWVLHDMIKNLFFKNN